MRLLLLAHQSRILLPKLSVHAAPSTPSRRSVSKISRNYSPLNTPSPPTSGKARAKSTGTTWFRESTALEQEYPRERSPRTRKQPPPPPDTEPVEQSKFKDPPKYLSAQLPTKSKAAGKPPPVFGQTPNITGPPPAPVRQVPAPKQRERVFLSGNLTHLDGRLCCYLDGRLVSDRSKLSILSQVCWRT